jgi:hypothetical protein
MKTATPGCQYCFTDCGQHAELCPNQPDFVNDPKLRDALISVHDAAMAFIAAVAAEYGTTEN